MRQHTPFESIYLDKFEVVEQVKGSTHLYPHTEQLPALSRAINLEFYGALPNRVAHADARAAGYHKVLLDIAAHQYCLVINLNRVDKLRLFPVLTPDRVAHIAIVQQITETGHGPPCHQFRLFTGQDFVPDIHLSGKRLVFADHVLQRFTTRVHQQIGDDLAVFLFTFFLAPIVALTVGKGSAFFVRYQDAFLAFTFADRAAEYFITTCLTANEINSLHFEMPPRAYNLHYGPAFIPPELRHWIPDDFASKYREMWEHKVPLCREPRQRLKDYTWHRAAGLVKIIADKNKHGPGSDIVFLDHIPGPVTLRVRPGQTEFQFDQRAVYRAKGIELPAATPPPPATG